MSELNDRLAELTGQRDRDLLDVTLVAALRDILGPASESVSIYRSVGERWLTRASLIGCEQAARAAPLWAEVQDLPELATYPVRVEAMRSERGIERAGATHLTVFPIATEHQVVRVLEIETRDGLDAQQQHMVTSILSNFQCLLDFSERDSLTGLLNRKTFDESFMKASAPATVPTGDNLQGGGPTRRPAATGSVSSTSIISSASMTPLAT